MAMQSSRGWRTLAGLAVLLAAALLAAATPAMAVHVNPQGLGQVLLFPYYTVNRQQQTYVSIVNGGTEPQAFQLTVREGYNGREVFGLTVFLAGNESWTATLFATDEIGASDGGAALLTADRSCTLPDIWTQNDGMVGDRPYRRLSTQALTDGGPLTAARTREGTIEVVALSSLRPPVSQWLTSPEGTRNCASVREADFSSPDLQGSAPLAQLFGAAGIIDVGQGTYLSQRLVAIAGFTAKPLIAQRDQDTLGLVNDGESDTVTAHVSVNGREVEAVYPRERAVDALSAVLTQAALYNEYLVDPALDAGSDWVVTFPTKRFYTDPALLAPATAAIAPFETAFAAPGESCVGVDVRYSDRPSGRHGEAVYQWMPIGTSIEGPAMCRVANVLSFQRASQGTSAVLGSTALVRRFDFDPSLFTTGPVHMALVGGAVPHALRPALPVGGSPGRVFNGLPAIGFWAMNLVNGRVADGVLANYGTAVPHAGVTSCTQCPVF